MDHHTQLCGHPFTEFNSATFPVCQEGHFLWPDLSLLLPGRAILTAMYFAAMLPLTPHESWNLVLLNKTGLVHSGGVDLVVDAVFPQMYPSEEGEVALPLNVTIEEGQILGLVHPCSGQPMQVVRGNGVSGLVALDAIPHSGQKISMAVESVEVSGHPRWAFGYETLTPKDGERSGGAVQILTSVKSDAKCVKEEPLLGSIREYSQSCSSWALQYPVYVLHTGKMEGVNGNDLLQWMEDVRHAAHPRLPLVFLDVSNEFPSVMIGDGTVKLDQHDLLWLDLTRSNSAYIRKHKPRRFDTGYRHMCRFQTSTVLSLNAFAHFRYLLHMDADATLLCSSDMDPFQEMAKEEYVYGLFEVGVEDPQFAQGWTEFLEEYIFLHEVNLPVPKELLSTTGAVYTKVSAETQERLNASTDGMALTWGTGWELLDLQFFTWYRVREFTEKVEKSLGHYRFNWGDHLIRAYQVQLFAPLSRVRCFSPEELPGRHGCRAFEQEAGGKYIFHFIENTVCPAFWLDVARGVPWTQGDHTPRPCLQFCINEEMCEGFDLFFYENQTADCHFREKRATEDACWPRNQEQGMYHDFDPATVLFGAANRYQIVERSLDRTLSCSRWQAGLEAKLKDPTSPPTW
eukprot:gnl/MRDRNA2_/MRDRNA2_150095_c0_seq1.p1 gnl/MRDRNA2_/MRDRNA2_150095_c0~~gnl/MRDRNA2_/MRDRNA2_150095_c0_seq1.p1  ORF type:complete len:627 (+),score=82.64 gnl/MRDRNA2_/MRDRNA2_150095_c0_seq1:255-2135(+)